MARNHYLGKPEATNHPHLRELLDAPWTGEEQKQAIIRELEKLHGPVGGRWSRSIALDQEGLHFKNGRTVVIQRQVDPRAAWAIAEPRDGEVPYNGGHPAGPRNS